MKNSLLSRRWSPLALPMGCLVAVMALGCANSDAAKPAAADKAPGVGPDGMVSAQSKHNGSGVELRYAPQAAGKPGDAVTVHLQFSNVTAPDGAQVELRPSDAQTQITINGTPVSEPIALATGVTRTLDVQVSAGEEGMHYLNVFTRQAGRSSAQAVGVKFGSGEQRLKGNGTATTTPSGERVISLPAR